MGPTFSCAGAPGAYALFIGLQVRNRFDALKQKKYQSEEPDYVPDGEGQFSNSLPAYKPVFFCMLFHECDASSLWSERFEIASFDLGVLTAGGAALSWVSDGPC